MSADVSAEQADFWGLTDEDHDDAKVADAELDVRRDFRPLAPSLVERYYGNRAAYINALEEQAAEDLASLAAAPADVPASWRLNRRINAAIADAKAHLERAALEAQT